MKKSTFAAVAGIIGMAMLGSGCAGELPSHTYWLKNQATGTYSAHRTYSELSDDEVKELGLVTELPADAKTID